MASFPERIETRRVRDEEHHFFISDDGDRYALREMYEMGSGRSVYSVNIVLGSLRRARFLFYQAKYHLTIRPAYCTLVQRFKLYQRSDDTQQQAKLKSPEGSM